MRKSLLRMTLRQLQVFCAVCEHRSYSRAAEAMALTQPAVSLQIRQLEEQVGLPLFEYVGRKLYLTEAAESLLSASGDIFERLDSLDMNLSTLQGSLRGELRLAAVSSVQYVLPHVLAAFRARYPQVTFQLDVASRAQIIQRLAENRDDLVIMGLVPADRALEFFPFLNNPIVAVARPDHPLAEQRQIPLARLEEEMVLQREGGSGIRKACDEFLQLKRVHLAQSMQLGSTEALVQGAIAGLGVALVPAHAAAAWVTRGELVCLDISELPRKRSWCAVHARDESRSDQAVRESH